MSRQAADRPMRALRAHRRGGPEELVYEQAPRPPLGIGDALVRVHAASFTPTELSWPSTWTDRLGRERTPVIPAHEVSGEVVALGFGTSGVEVGQEVFGLTDWYRDGAAADYVAVEARNLAPQARHHRPPAGRGGALGRADRLAGPVRPRAAAGGSDGAGPRGGGRGRQLRGAAGERGRRPGDRHRSRARR
jgi:hypothetical protein